jgi:ArsR family transcriptional regulator
MCHAFPAETRLDILDWLKEGERCVCELTDALQTGQLRLSFYLTG